MRLCRVIVGVSLASAFFAAPAMAACTYGAPLWHDFSYFSCADSQPVSDLAYQADDPIGATSGTLDIACEEASCSPFSDAGAIGDERVVIFMSWTHPAAVGCPGDLGPGSVMHRVNLVVQGSDGRGLIASLGRGRRDNSWAVESAHRLSTPQGLVFPLPCTDQTGRPQVLSSQEITPGQVTLGLHFPVPLVYSDCDPGTRGMLVGSCTDGFQSNPAIGRVFTRVTPTCTGRQDLRRTLWTDTGQHPDAGGNLTLTVPRPSGTQCLLLGATSIIGGYESGGITGFIKIPGQDCVDLDGDGWSTCDGDCSDSQPAAFPGHTEVCDLVDNDCDGLTDEGQTTCGTGACQRTVADCVGGAPQACVPGTPTAEICDGVDNDCNGSIDEVDPDGDGYRCAGDCDETNPLVHANAVEVCNAIDDDCDGNLDEDPFGIDSDADGVHNACDRCPSVADPEQQDADDDGQGDACDLDDGEIVVFPAPQPVAWQAEAVFSSFNLYRSDLEVLRQTGEYTQDPAAVPSALQVCAQTGASFADPLTPDPGKVFLYHVTGNCDGVESPLGMDSAGQPRPNAHACPQTDTSQCPVCDKPATHLMHGDAPAVPDGDRVIDNQAAWNLFCAQVGSDDCAFMVDFATEVAIVSKITGPDLCYDTAIACVQTVGATAGLHVVLQRTTSTLPPCGCPTAIGDPYDVVKVQRPVGTVTFETRSAPRPCGTF